MLSPKLIVLLAGATISNFLLTWSLYRAFHSPRSNPWNAAAIEKYDQFSALKADTRDTRQYSFKEDDYPSFAPINLPKEPVRLTIEESVHYSPFETQLSTKEWLYNSPWGTGTYRGGSEHTLFFVAGFHDMHCLRHIHASLLNTHHKSKGWGHLQHCFNIVRQSILCQADMTLEEGDFTQRDFTKDRFGATHICRDWDAVYDEIGSNWVEWRRHVKTTNLTMED
ncbi:hypothetical protein PM082_018735 [Marasmius tenuissimus]|nr:hypothetical protein PM082_018735 [Marasmius tenuissimus]